MKTLVVAGAIAAALAAPVAAQAHASPKTVAWEIRNTVNQNLKFGGSKLRVLRVVCESRGYPIFICKGTFSNHLGTMIWSTVTRTDDGHLKFSGGHLA